MQEVARQLTGIGGGRPMGFGANRVRSLPDGVAQVLKDYLEQWEEREQGGSHRSHESSASTSGAGATGMSFSLDMGQLNVPEPPKAPQVQKIGDLCPDCGVAALVNEEGCRKCYACGYSEC